MVGGHINPRPPHHIAAGDLVVKGMEPTCAVLLGTAVKHTLESSNGVQAIGLSDGPSRILGTHQRSSLLRHASMKQGPFAQGRLCCPTRHHYYDPLRLPPGCRPLPGVTGYRQTRSRPPQGRGRVGPLQFPRQPSHRSTSPTPEGSSTSAPGSQMSSMAFAKSTQARHPHFPAHAGALTTLQTSLHVADRPVAPPRFDPGLSTGPGGFTTRDPDVSPNRTHTGWLSRACARLCHDRSFAFMASELLDARGFRLRRQGTNAALPAVASQLFRKPATPEAVAVRKCGPMSVVPLVVHSGPQGPGLQSVPNTDRLIGATCDARHSVGLAPDVG